MNNQQSGILRETLAKEFRAKEKWSERYGHKFQTQVLAQKDIVPGNNITREYRRPQLRYWDHESDGSDTESEDEEEEGEDGSIELKSGLTGQFAGCYVPDVKSKRTFSTTNKEKELLKTRRDVVHPQTKTEEELKNHRKKDWMKNYFEESSRQKLIDKGMKKGAS